MRGESEASTDESGANAIPAHVESSVRSIVDFHIDHARKASIFERAIERTTAVLGRPRFVAFITLFVAVWVVANLYGRANHTHYLDEPPFAWLQNILSLAALYVTALILTTQRRLDRLAEERAQLTLQIALVNEQKTTKIIALLEELRADHPEIADRHDLEADAMSVTTDPQMVLDRLREGHHELLAADDGSSSAPFSSG